MKKKNNLTHAEMLAEFANSDQFFSEYLNRTLTSDSSINDQLIVISDVIEALLIAKKLNKTEIAEHLEITRDALYKMAKHKNPTLSVFLGLMKTLGLKLQFTVEKKKKSAT
jgi:DNA-binding phage protein